MNSVRSILILLILLSATSVKADSDWELRKDEDEIRVYTRSVDNWDIEEFKVIKVMNVKRYIIYETLIDILKYPEWYPDITGSEILKKVSETEYYIYSKIDIPWPSTDRDGECHMKITHNKTDKTTLINLTACEKYKARNDQYVRMTSGRGFWKLTSKEDKTVVHYQYLGDPGGSLSAWIINMFIVDSPFNTMKALQTRVGG